MQSRLAAIANRTNVIFQIATARNQSLIKRGLANKATTTGTPGDTDIYSRERDQDPSFPSQEPEGMQDVAEPKHPEKQEREQKWDNAETGPFVSPKPPYTSSPKLENPGLSQSSQPNTQQKRRNTTESKNLDLEQVSCVGLDGTPWPDIHTDKDNDKDRLQDRDEQEKDDKEYFKDHKASPLAEIKMADTRKPISRATDGTADSGYGGGKDVIGWLPEQLVSAEDVLIRAAEMFKLNAMRGDPDSPHGRVLRARLGEIF